MWEKVMRIFNSYLKTGRALTVISLMALSPCAQAAIESIDGSDIHLYAQQFQIATPDGDSIRMWGFAPGDAGGPTGEPQYPAPTLRLEENDTVIVTLHNTDVPQDVTLEFPGQSNVCVKQAVNQANCLSGQALENAVASANGNNSVVYTFTASKPGTYMYQSGINPQVQVDMGLVGALIVDPDSSADAPDGATYADATTGQVVVHGVSSPDHHAIGLAYNNAETAYDREYLFFLSETDPKLHYLAELDRLDSWDNGDYHSVLFFINGRNAPDTLADHNVPQLPNQPYGSLVLMHPGQRVLLRVINAGRNQHPLHLHGNHFFQVARDGNLMGERDAMTGDVTDLRPVVDYTYGAVQGGTSDLVFNWTGKELGWDMYGVGPGYDHTCADTENNLTHSTLPEDLDGLDDESWEYCADHNKPLPVVLPENLDLAFGGFWGGSPYLGNTGTLPVGEGGLNPYGGMVFMWHSHSERELTNNDIYPGGMLTMMIVFPYDEGTGDVDQ
jgi:FtsP/CotA-like multicopper oxidase with cupredoxin domain